MADGFEERNAEAFKNARIQEDVESGIVGLDRIEITRRDNIRDDAKLDSQFDGVLVGGAARAVIVVPTAND